MFSLATGLIEGAHENKGLGHDFLRHIERTKALLFVIDGAGSENRLPHRDLRLLVKELNLYDKSLMKKPAFVFANKIDLGCDEEQYKKLEREAKLHSMRVLRGSAHMSEGMSLIATELRKVVTDEEYKKPRFGRKRLR